MNHPDINNYIYIYIYIHVSAKGCVGIQTAALLVTLWILCGHPVRNKRAGYLFEFHLSIILAVIWIPRTVASPKNWMWYKSLWEFLLILYWLPQSKVTIRISIISVETSVSIIIVAHRTCHTFSYRIFQQNEGDNSPIENSFDNIL